MRAAQVFLMTIALLAAGIIGPAAGVLGQDSNNTKNIIESRNYIFKAETVTPASGRTRQLTTEYYTVKVSGDSVIADLPYFGRAYSAPLGSSGGINFTSTKFDYAATIDKKNRWQVSIKPKDMTEVQELLFTIFENGNADLRVTSTNRQHISFRGHITGM